MAMRMRSRPKAPVRGEVERYCIIEENKNLGGYLGAINTYLRSKDCPEIGLEQTAFEWIDDSIDVDPYNTYSKKLKAKSINWQDHVEDEDYIHIEFVLKFKIQEPDEEFLVRLDKYNKDKIAYDTWYEKNKEKIHQDLVNKRQAKIKQMEKLQKEIDELRI